MWYFSILIFKKNFSGHNNAIYSWNGLDEDLKVPEGVNELWNQIITIIYHYIYWRLEIQWNDINYSFFSFVLKDQPYASGRINTKMRRLHIAINECYICISRMEFIPRDVTISTLHVLIDDEMNYIWRKPLHFINTLSRKTTQISLYEYKLFKKSYSLKICL